VSQQVEDGCAGKYQISSSVRPVQRQLQTAEGYPLPNTVYRRNAPAASISKSVLLIDLDSL
jgi:hypothetical protein